jgi:hypothetical protein
MLTTLRTLPVRYEDAQCYFRKSCWKTCIAEFDSETSCSEAVAEALTPQQAPDGPTSRDEVGMTRWISVEISCAFPKSFEPGLKLVILGTFWASAPVDGKIAIL